MLYSLSVIYLHNTFYYNVNSLGISHIDRHTDISPLIISSQTVYYICDQLSIGYHIELFSVVYKQNELLDSIWYPIYIRYTYRIKSYQSDSVNFHSY